ncbi:Type VI secretion system lysozyme [Burkholderia sp. 8Y]|uniref:type VI secretion system baseplate subunit TssE n=1 Tax=Burkholderia sp. 8Y TaxID=2653133 RepID=UPI0012F2C35D|nr:type VI secretion system baseplate subunit TssE [Burkholderia sp. 8Y]VXB14103.1 Type VI secretion system lysozyme [Burkholderia sp. 8Y]
MSDPTTRDRLQPSLLDRLTDHDPHARTEPRERRVMSSRALRESVRRDIGWLLNASGLPACIDTAGFPHVATSVLNYGLPDLAGCNVAALTPGAVERLIRDALWAFEPRLARESVRVSVIEDAKNTARGHVICFEIEAQMWSRPYPERLHLRTELDLEAGEVRIADAAPTRNVESGQSMENQA